GGLFIRMTRAEGSEYVLVAFLRKDGLEAELGDPLLPPALADCGIRVLPALERPRTGGVPRAALVVADPAGPCSEERFTNGVECLARHEHDELPVQVSLPAGRERAFPWLRSRSGRARHPRNTRTSCSTSTWTTSSRFSPRPSRTGPARGRVGSSCCARAPSSDVTTTSRQNCSWRSVRRRPGSLFGSISWERPRTPARSSCCGSRSATGSPSSPGFRTVVWTSSSSTSSPLHRRRNAAVLR